MSPFTPGPWTTDGPNEQDDYCIWAGDGAFLANVGTGEKSVEDEERPQGGDCIAFDVTTRANALLMAAAPDLYAALEAVTRAPFGCRFCDSGSLRAPQSKGHDANCGFALAAAALAKARGEPCSV